MKNCRALLKEKYGFHSTVVIIDKTKITDSSYNILKASKANEFGLVIYQK